MSTFDRRYELMPRAELEQLQLERLQALLARLRRSVRRYREKLAEAPLHSLADVAALPFTTPEEVAASFPYGLFALPLREVIRLHSTLGPAGQPLVIGHTRNDLVQWGRLAARQLAAGGLTAHDVVLISLGGAVHPGASGYVLGAELIEASVIAEEALHIDAQLAMLQTYRPTFLITTPTNAFALVETLEKRRLDPQSLPLRAVLLSRPVDPDTRAHLAARLLAAVQCNFGVSEILDPGLCTECEAGQLHVHEDQFLAETCQGELVLTTLGREAMPLLRYRTHIAAELLPGKCPCGRTAALLRVGPRLDQRFRVKETCFYSPQIAGILAQTRAAGLRFLIQPAEERLRIDLEISKDLFAGTLSGEENPKADIESELAARLGLQAEVRFVESLPEAGAYRPAPPG
jgi:phenylacetate-CoA ligase